MNYVPVVKSVKRMSGGRLGEKHTVLLFDQVESGGGIQYKFILGVFSNEDLQPVYFVASESNTMAKFGGGSHFMGLFEGNGHSNLGSKDEWGDAAKFFPDALGVVTAQFDPERGEKPVELTKYDDEDPGQRFDHDKMQQAFMDMVMKGGPGPGMPKLPCSCGCMVTVLVVLAMVVTAVVVLVRMFM